MPEPYKKPVCRGSYALGTACGKCERCKDNEPWGGAEAIDISMPTPDEIAKRLGAHFSQDQAEAIAADVYQPIRAMLRGLALRGIR